MSIYALPWPLCKLISSGASTKSSKEDAELACASSKDTFGSNYSSLSMPPIPAAVPLRSTSSSGYSTSSSGGAGGPGSSILDLSNNSNTSNSSSIERTTSKGNSNVKLAVKEAKIDAAALIRSLSQKQDPKKSIAKGLSGEAPADELAANSSTSSSPATQRRRGRRKNDFQCRSDKSSEANTSVATADRECEPHEDAINFEISVSFNGREYTASRSLPRILQFRLDLLEEFRARRMWRERRRKRNKSKRRSSQPPDMKKVYDLSDDEGDEDDESSQDDKDIPELPRLSEDAAGNSGFTMLNALLRAYNPALERWFHNIIDIVPHDSQCLTQFLWEPLHGQVNKVLPVGKDRRRAYVRRSSSMSSALGAIVETGHSDSSDHESLCDYDSDTDNYLLNTA